MTTNHTVNRSKELVLPFIVLTVAMAFVALTFYAFDTRNAENIQGTGAIIFGNKVLRPERSQFIPLPTKEEPACPTGETRCNGQCSKTNTDINNCGACGNKCDWIGGFSCVAGSCQCGSGQRACPTAGGRLECTSFDNQFSCGQSCEVCTGFAACSGEPGARTCSCPTTAPNRCSCPSENGGPPQISCEWSACAPGCTQTNPPQTENPETKEEVSTTFSSKFFRWFEN